jgi:hypothetical protein
MTMDTGYPLVVMSTVLGLATYSGCHPLLARFWHAASPYPALITSFFPGLMVTTVATATGLFSMQAPFSDWIGYGLLNVVTYAALGWGYFHFVNLCVASLRIRVLEELSEHGGQATAAHLFARYNDDHLIATRIERLVRGGHLRLHGDRYTCGKPYFLWTARLFAGLRRVILG